MRAARYVQSLLQSNRIAPEPLETLDAVYRGKGSADESGVLTRAALEAVMRALVMAPEEAKELLRTQEQVLMRVEKEKSS